MGMGEHRGPMIFVIHGILADQQWRERTRNDCLNLAHRPTMNLSNPRKPIVRVNLDNQLRGSGVWLNRHPEGTAKRNGDLVDTDVLDFQSADALLH